MEEARVPASSSEARKRCVACREPIPVEATVCSHCQRKQPRGNTSFKKIAAWAAGIAAVLGVFASLFGGLQWINDHWSHHREITAELSVAESLMQRGEYEAAVTTYGDVLKKDPRNQRAADEQVTAAMRWTENFHVLTGEGEKATEIAGPKIDTILAVLDARLPRAKGARAADILAHIGWAHWLNWRIAEREISPAAERDFRAALQIDPSNVYANAMLGNWLLQNNGNVQEAVRHFASAVQSGNEHPWVRTMQLGGLLSNSEPQSRVELIKVVNEMRKNHESLDDDEKHRIFGASYNFSSYGTAELADALSAVPPDESWATYDWLDDRQSDDPAEVLSKQLRRDYVSAKLVELSGNKSEALSKYKALQTKLKTSRSYGTLTGAVDSSIKRLTTK